MAIGGGEFRVSLLVVAGKKERAIETTKYHRLGGQTGDYGDPVLHSIITNWFSADCAGAVVL